MNRKVFFTVIFLLSTMLAAAQTDFSKEWKRVDSLYRNEDYNKAYDKASKLYQEALRQHDSRNTLAGAYHLSRIAAEYQENAEDSALNRYLAIEPKLAPLEKAFCHAFIAKFYRDYSRMNYWTINRNKATDEADLDYKLWPQERFDSEIKRHIEAALKERVTLRSTDINDVEMFCQKPYSDGILTTPTLYDLVMDMAIESEPDARERLRLMEELVDFHNNDSKALRIWLDLRKLELEKWVPNGVKPTAETYLSYAERYGSDCDMVTLFYYEAALMLRSQDKMVEAKGICEKAVAMYPESKGGVECANLIKQITHPECSLSMEGGVMADRSILAVASYRNVDTLYFRIIKKFDHKDVYDREKLTDMLLKRPVVEGWKQAVKRGDDYKSRKAYVYMPQLATGEYYVLVSTSVDFRKNGLSYGEFTCCDAMIITALGNNNALHGYVILRDSGKPVAGQKMRLEQWSYDKHKYVATGLTATTDKEGYYEFRVSEAKLQRSSLRVATDYKGVTIEYGAQKHNETKHAGYVNLYCQKDRPVYKLGETVSFAYICYFGDGHTQNNVCKGAELFVKLRDVNEKAVDSVKLTTDEYGVCHGELKIPADALPGRFNLYTEYKVDGKKGADYENVSVEEYKQPKFTVKLYGDNEEHTFGKELTVGGLAASYSQVPIDGARVSYTVTRREMYRPWRCWFMPTRKETTVAGGETTTDGEGKFEIRFAPLPDSSVELSRKPCFVYTVAVDVTDINGETHSQSYSLRVGYENSYISLSANDKPSVELSYRNLDGAPLDGTVTLEVLKLRLPAQPKLNHSVMDTSALHALSRSEFEKRYGLLAYDQSDIDPELWAVERRLLTKSVKVNKEAGEASIPLDKIEPGVYRIKAWTIDGDGQRVESHITYFYMPDDSKKVQNQELVWTSELKSSYGVGETLRLNIGTRFKDVKLYYILSKEGSPIERKIINLDEEVKSIEFPILESYKGNVHIDLLAVKENVMWSKNMTVSVPYADKKLDVTIETFRDKLQPGENETWTIKVKTQSNKSGTTTLTHSQNNTISSGVAANLMMTMYDAALNNYGGLSASLSPWSTNYNPSMLDWSTFRFDLQDWQVSPQLKYVTDVSVSTWRLLDGIFSRHRIMYRKNSRALSGRGGVVYEVEEVAMAKGADMDGMVNDVAMVANVESETALVDEESEVSSTQATEQSGNDEVQLRTNLNTLAFFAPVLRTGDDGSVSYSFTVPELLTEWSILGLAHTKDMKTGSIAKSLITQKELMVQPNAPRFLRHGDTLDFLAKVMNLTDEQQEVTVTFELTDAADSKFKVQSSKLKITVPAHASEQVSFRIAVPDNIYVANYRIIAQGRHHGDGEQDCLPVLSNKQMVTVSQAMYINGKGEKSYDLPAISSQQSAVSTRRPHLLKVEFTSNPIWYAIQALPYLEERQDPSNIYLVNQLYTNTLAFNIVKDNPSIETVFNQWVKDTVNPLISQLEKNEDVKQTVLDETPWLRDGVGETQQMHRIAEYFNHSKLSSQLKRAEKKLFDDQRSDGGWSWISGCRYSSLYTTQYILQRLGSNIFTQSWSSQVAKPIARTQAIKKALAFVDKENYDYYQRYLKKTDFEALNIDYLYMRSFYNSNFKIQNSKFQESYDYFFRNTLKHYKEYKSLRTRAQLALIFHRAGNRKEALDIIRRIKESALHSDEMGMYWRDNTASWWWYERPIETQALIIQAFSEITPDDKESIGQMQQWLLKQKQTTRWDTDISTVEAVNALISSSNATSIKLDTVPCRVTVAGQPLNSPAQAGTGYQSQSWFGDEITQLLAKRPDIQQSSNQAIRQSGNQAITITKLTDGIAWGAAYYQFLDDMDKIERNEMGVKLQKTLYKVKTDGTLEAILNPVKSKLKVGDRVRIRILFDCDRNLEYVELKDGRPACFESVSSASGWHWNSGLSYYASVLNASNNFYIDRLDKGKYILEYDIFVTNTGSFTLPATTIQCLYAPEFRANGNGGKLTIAR